MISLLLALASQATLEPGPAVPLPCKEPILVTASSTGKFVVVAEPKKVHVLDGETLRPVHAVDFECTAVGFGAKDELLTIVGTQAVRIDTKGWKETFRADLPDVEFRKPGEKEERIIVFPRRPPDGWLAGQAKVSPDGDVHYRSKGGRLMWAKEEEGKWVGKPVFDEGPNDVSYKVEVLLGIPPGPVLVRLGGITGVVHKRKLYTLAASGQPLAVGVTGAEVPVVVAKHFCVFSSVSWKNLGVSGSLKDGEENRSAVFDAKRNGFWIARGGGLRWWDGRKESGDRPVEGATGTFGGLAIDGSGARLYAMEVEKLRGWRLKD